MSWVYLLIMGGIFLYDEVVFHIAVLGAFSTAGLLYTALFAVSFGILMSFLPILIPRKGPRVGIALALMILCALPFLIEYFIYLQFKILYDVTTITAGTGDVLKGFTAQIFRLVFSRNGLLIILVYALPILVYGLIARKVKMKPRILWAIASPILGIGLLFLTRFLILQDPVHAPMYDKEYNFQAAVTEFGLGTGLRLDIQKSFFEDADSIAFEDETLDDLLPEPESESVPEPESSESIEPEESVEPEVPEESSSEPEESESEAPEEPEPEPEPEPVVYEPNVLDIDFEALADASNGKVAELDRYVASQTPSMQNAMTGLFKGKNLIFLSAEAFSDALIDPELTPTLYRMATKGIQFTDYYQPASAGTTGGEYENLFGMLPTSGGSSFKMTATHYNYMTMGAQLDRLGYTGWAFHNNDYMFYSREKTHINLGYSNGYMGYGNGMEEYVTYDWPESDLEMFQGTMPLYLDAQPFNIYYMTVSGHSPYSHNPAANILAANNWDRVEDLPYSDPVKSYISANLDLEDGLTFMIEQLEEAGIADDTVIVLSADHFPYGLDDDAALGQTPYLDELYGYSPTNYLERDHNRLLLWSGCLEDMDPIVIDTPTSSLDILPTLSNLFGTEYDSRLFPGRDVFSDAMPLVFNINFDWKTDLGTYIAGTGTFTPAQEGRFIPDTYVEKVKSIVRNKFNYCKGALETDYFRHVFEREE